MKNGKDDTMGPAPGLPDGAGRPAMTRPGQPRSKNETRPAGAAVERRLLIACSLMHFVNDGLFYVIFFIVPLAALDFNLSLAQASLIKTFFTLFSSLLQYPCALLTGWIGDAGLLALGTGWVALGMVVMGLSTGVGFLWASTIGAGIGGSAQHPVGSSLISRIYPERSRGRAIGTLNFGGDVGKAVFAVLMSFLLAYVGWRQALYLVGVFAAVVSGAWYIAVRRLTPSSVPGHRDAKDPRRTDTAAHPARTVPAAGGGVETSMGGRIERWRFAIISLIGMLDNSTRSTLLTFLPFLFLSKGLDKSRIGIYLTLVAVGGLFGKLGCGILADFLGNVKMIVITEVLTASLILLFIVCSPATGLVLAAVLGFFLNGTSSVIYAQAAGVIPAAMRTRGYGLFFTFTLGSAATVPFLFGILGDFFKARYPAGAGLTAIFVGMAVMTGMILPLAAGFHGLGRRLKTSGG